MTAVAIGRRAILVLAAMIAASGMASPVGAIECTQEEAVNLWGRCRLGSPLPADCFSRYEKLMSDCSALENNNPWKVQGTPINPPGGPLNFSSAYQLQMRLLGEVQERLDQEIHQGGAATPHETTDPHQSGAPPHETSDPRPDGAASHALTVAAGISAGAQGVARGTEKGATTPTFDVPPLVRGPLVKEALAVGEYKIVTDTARQYMKEGDSKQASNAIDQVLARDRNNPEALGLRAYQSAGQGRIDEALKDANTALARDPNNELALRIKAYAESTKHHIAGRPLPSLNFGAKLDSAVSEGSGAAAALRGGVGAATPPVVRSPAASLAQSLIEGASLKIRLGDFTAARLDISRAVAADKTNVRGLALSAFISNKLKNYEAAKKDADAALALDPVDVQALFERGYAQLQLGNLRLAQEDIEHALSLDPESALGHLYYAMVLEGLARKPEAISEYRLAERYDLALKPLADEAIARLLGDSKKPAARGATASKLPILALFGLTAAALLLLGLRRVFQPEEGGAAPAAAAPDKPLAALAGTLMPGMMLGRNFRIERELARGGIGVVYQATDLTLKRTVAVKHLNKDAYASAAVREKFLKEAQLAAKLSHPNLARIFSVIGKTELYLVFEFVEGETLHERLVRKIKLPLPEVKRVLFDVAEAVDYAHARNIIHRDLKPSNIMMTADGHYKVLDFGIAHEARTLSDVTPTQVWGTPPYMAPEQEMGAVRKESDLYALGVTIYELIVGQKPFDGAGMLEKKLNNDFRPVKRANPDAAASLHPFFVKALACDPTKRYPTAKEMSRALSAIEDTPVGAA